MLGIPCRPFSFGTTKPQQATPEKKQLSEQEQRAAIFAGDTTFTLIKKLIIYRTMSSNLFINHALNAMNACYKVMGKRLTNLIINKTAGEVFTSGETLETLSQDIKLLE